MGIQRGLICALLLLAAAFTHATDKFAELKGNPGLKSASALVLDSAGNVIYGKDVDTVRPIASITKLMTAMVVLDSGLPLDGTITITKEDRDLIRLTGSRLEYGATLTRREMILLALMSSDASTVIVLSPPALTPVW